jgi:mannose/fructose/N-acetylgalactosamine-specific phosphotransferase system component IID
MIASTFVGSRYSLDELIAIIRPVVYVYAVMKLGRKSFAPLKISLVLDIAQIVIGVTRLNRSSFYEAK